MYDVQIDIATNTLSADTRPDGIYRFKVCPLLDQDELARLLWGAAHFNIPFFAQNKITRFVLHRDGCFPVVISQPDDVMDDPRLCRYMGRSACVQYAETLH